MKKEAIRRFKESPPEDRCLEPFWKRTRRPVDERGRLEPWVVGPRRAEVCCEHEACLCPDRRVGTTAALARVVERYAPLLLPVHFNAGRVQVDRRTRRELPSPSLLSQDLNASPNKEADSVLDPSELLVAEASDEVSESC